MLETISNRMSGMRARLRDVTICRTDTLKSQVPAETRNISVLQSITCRQLYFACYKLFGIPPRMQKLYLKYDADAPASEARWTLLERDSRLLSYYGIESGSLIAVLSQPAGSP
ncbi:hypothetical protein EV182_002343 [Spiromyces aspiralis]|uniref:Uncharacterized protein n=1 Tax=Spiromyces aspiralis TaxID=68401 RepID=A0ACC1HFV0_9FUNG|nr:hypothetical protein EV182_002343 [Spiromyces aspiralis]